MTQAQSFARVVVRAAAAARTDRAFHLEGRSIAEQASMQRFVQAARQHAEANRQARSFRHFGRLFRLRRFDGWLIVMTWRGLPIAGPVRMSREVSA